MQKHPIKKINNFVIKSAKSAAQKRSAKDECIEKLQNKYIYF